MCGEDLFYLLVQRLLEVIQKVLYFWEHRAGPGLKHSYFNWQNEKYQSFMVQFLSHLEPIELKKGQVIFNELENVDMIIFMSEASIDLGYDARY